MNKAIIGRKAGMTQIFTAEGKVIPVTVIEAGPCPIVQIKTVEKDGYSALKLGFGEAKEKTLTKPELGQYKKAGVKPCKVLKEFRLAELASYEVGKEVKVDVFSATFTELRKVTASLALSRDGISTDLKKLTASAPCTENPVQWAR